MTTSPPAPVADRSSNAVLRGGCSAKRHIDVVDLWWDEVDAQHVTTRSARYLGAQDIDPAWTARAAADPARVVCEPDPRSRTGCLRPIGCSASAGFVTTVIVDPIDSCGVPAWKTRGGDLRTHLEEGPQR